MWNDLIPAPVQVTNISWGPFLSGLSGRVWRHQFVLPDDVRTGEMTAAGTVLLLKPRSSAYGCKSCITFQEQKKKNTNMDCRGENTRCYFAKTLLWCSTEAPLEMMKKVGILTSPWDERLTPGARGGPASKGLLVSFSNWAEARHSWVAPVLPVLERKRSRLLAVEVHAEAKGYQAEVIFLHSYNVLAFLN